MEEAELLKSCYRNCIRIANERGLQSLAFPSISTGAYGYPIEKACRTALQSVKEELENATTLERVLFVTFSPSDFQKYQEAYREISNLHKVLFCWLRRLTAGSDLSSNSPNPVP